MSSAHRFTPTAPVPMVRHDAIAQACARADEWGGVWSVWFNGGMYFVSGRLTTPPSPNARLIGQATRGIFCLTAQLEEVKR